MENQDQDHHFSTFYEDNALLIQFIMVEFVHIYQLTFQIKALIQDRLDFISDSRTFLSSLTPILAQLVGYLPQQEQSSFSRWTKGSLTKFKEYCERFSYNSFHQNKQHVHLHMAAHQAWLTAIHNMELLNSLHTNSHKKNLDKTLFLIPLKRTFNTLHLRFNQVIRYIPRVIGAYWDDENVMLCLLRKQAQLTEIYGSDFLCKRFKWPIKRQELMPFLAQRYQNRGFEALIPTIQQVCNSEEKIYDAS